MEQKSIFNQEVAERYKDILYKAMKIAVDNLGTNLVPNKPDKKDELIKLLKDFPNASNKAKIAERFAVIAAKPRSPENQYGINRCFNSFLYYFRDGTDQPLLANYFLGQVVVTPLNHGVADNDALLTRNHKSLASKDWVAKTMHKVVDNIDHQSSVDVRNKKRDLITYSRLFTISTDVVEQKNVLRLFYYTVAKNSSDPGYSHSQLLDLFYKKLSEKDDLLPLVYEMQKDIQVLRANRRPWIELKPQDLVTQKISTCEYEITKILEEIEHLRNECVHPGKRKGLEENYKKAREISLNLKIKPQDKQILLKNHLTHCRQLISATHFGTFFKAASEVKEKEHKVSSSPKK